MQLKKFTYLLLIVAILISYNSKATLHISEKDTSLGFFDNANNRIKAQKARHLFLNGDTKGALDIYHEVHKSNQQNAALNTRIGECYLVLKQFEKAKEYLEKAYALNPNEPRETAFYLGQALHRLGEFDRASQMFDEFIKDNNPKKEDVKDAIFFKQQVATAKELMAKPKDVTISNMGALINSPFEDYGPSISADGKTIIFTSRRPTNKGGAVDINDGKFYEDIYIAEWDDEKNTFGEAKPIQGRLNTEYHDACLNISPDGKFIFVYKNVPGETKSGDIYVSKLSGTGKWGAPEPLPKQINSSYFESSASLSADGKWLYFVSERRGGFGNGDIYRSKKISKTEWGEAENLGPVINTEEDEISVFIHPDGKTLFFSSKGHNTMGGYDIFKSVYENGQWSKPENIGYPINTLGDDLHFVLSADNQTAFYSAIDTKGFGERDIMQIDMSRFAILEKDGKPKVSNGLSILKGSIVDTDAGQAIEAEVKILDANGTEVASTASGIDGEYFITLPGGKDYIIELKFKNFDAKEKIFLPLDEKHTYTMVKHFLVDRKNKQLKTNDKK
ncbi:MAG: hypothetical protein KatS3mg035_1632 [Bacteroidia bacterium]|nr:MAG: hypothetical protein KatS3mg035_1632 [Bacteroidia bacterium]